MNVNRSNLGNQKGFSLVELMIVVAIIGILSAIAVPNFQNFQAKSRQSEAKAVLSAMYVANKAFFNEWQMYTTDFGMLGYVPEGLFRYEHGFTGAPVPPPNYQGPGATGNISTAFCAADTVNAASGCGVIRGGVVAPGAIAAAASTRTVFLGEARGDLNNAAGVDIWQIDQNKDLQNTRSDI